MKRIFLGITLIAALVLGGSVYAQTPKAKTDVKKEQTSTVKKDQKKSDKKTNHKATKAKPMTSTTMKK